jgi:hypothetical protein
MHKKRMSCKIKECGNRAQDTINLVAHSEQAIENAKEQMFYEDTI